MEAFDTIPTSRGAQPSQSHRPRRKVAIQGIAGSFHDIAAHQYFADEEIELITCDTFEALIETVQADASVRGLMAIENTIAGSLLHNYDLLRQSGLVVIGEHKLHIAHSLMCLPDDDWDTLQEVNSHPVALMQCRHFLAGHPKLKVVETADTAGAAADIAQHRKLHHAAICHEGAAARYGLKVLQAGIEDNKHNFTRFLILSHPSEAPLPEAVATSAVNKSSMVFALPHEEGCLSQVLSILSFYRMNLTKIQSLPIIGREWEYLFYVDVTFDDYTRYRQSIEAVRPLLRKLKLLGEYVGK